MSPAYPTNVNNTYYNLSIDGFDIIAEEITPNESYNRRETSRKSVIGGTQAIVRTNYLPRDYNVVCHFMIDPLFPDVYDDTFREWQSKSVEVISKDMGGKFNAECIVKTSTTDSPNYLRIELQLVEIPDTKSLIPNDTVEVPSDVKSNVKITSTTNRSKKKKKKNNKTKKDKKKDKKKGNKITKTKKNT